MSDHNATPDAPAISGAEENLLKLAEILSDLTPDEAARWQAIRSDFLRHKKQGGAEADSGTKLANLAADMAVTLDDISGSLRDAKASEALTRSLSEGLAKLAQALPVAPPQLSINMPEQPQLAEAIRALVNAYETALLPTVSAMNHKIRLDHEIWEKVQQIGDELQQLQQRLSQA